MMKATLFVLCFFCATAAFGQSTVGGSALSSQPQMVQFSSHPERAARQSLALEQDLREGSGFFSAKGERPLWEVAPVSKAVPLGDTARILRQQHAGVKKAKTCWEN